MQETAATGAQPLAAWTVIGLRTFSWAMVALTLAYVLNGYLVFWLGWPGIAGLFSGEVGLLALVQLASYGAVIIGAGLFCQRTADRTLRQDCAAITAVAGYLVRALFWAVVLVGLADFVVSLLRIETLLPVLVGDQMATDLGRSAFRAPLIHLPLILVGFVIAAFTRALAFHWLALGVVVAELVIVLSRFVFSYEQALQADLVRFWYAAMFLFASAHTLVEDGHVRVDVFYAEFSTRAKGWSNAFGSVFMGMVLCWSILITGMWARTSAIVSPVLAFEVTQAGFGLYVKFWMAAFLGAFAVTMLIQFSAYFLGAMADALGEPGGEDADRSADAGQAYPEIETAEVLAGGAPSH